MEYKHKEYNQFVQDARKAGYEPKHSEWDNAPYIVCETPKLHVVLGQISVLCRYFCAGIVSEGYKITPSKPVDKRPIPNPQGEETEDLT